MITIQDSSLLAGLSDILSCKRNSSETIDNCLQLVCSTFGFDCGLVYEKDEKDIFHLKEKCASCTEPLHPTFAIDTVDLALRTRLITETLACLSRTGNPTLHELALLDFFQAAYLVIASVVDEKPRSQGFIIFINADTERPVPATALPTLRFLCNLLGKYISVRVHQNKFQLAQKALHSVLDNTGIDIYVNDFYTHEILYANKTMAAPYGGKNTFLGKKCWEVLFPGQLGPCEFCPQNKLIDEQGNPTKIYSWNYQRPFDGSWFRVFSAAFQWVDGRLAHVVSSADITENKRNEALIHYMANYDPLTELPNRRMLVSACQDRITSAHSGEKAFLLFFDIDGFKAINDNHGHDAGDEFLVQLGNFFSSIPMLKNAIYRNGGDEFVALIGDGITETHIRNLANFIHERFKKPWMLKAGPVYCGTSIGAACFPDDAETAEELINKADQAMYHIKKSGGAALAFYNEKDSPAPDTTGSESPESALSESVQD